MNSKDVRDAQKAFQDDLRKKLKEGLEAADDHPVGHVVCQLIRGKVKGEIQDGKDAVRIALEAALGGLSPEDFQPPKK